MTALIIICGIILLLLILLLLPITIDLSYNDKLLLKIKYFGITIFNSSKKKKAKKVKQNKEAPVNEKNKKEQKKKDNFVISTYKQKGLSGTISFFGNILTIVFKKLWWLIKHLKFRKFKLDLSIAGDDAAETAIEYGKVCAAIYPILSLLQTIINLKSEQINIKADFENNKTKFKIAFVMTTSVLNYIILLISALTQYLKLKNKESEKHERKQS